MLSESEIRDVIARTVRETLAPSDVRVAVREGEGLDDESFHVVMVSVRPGAPPDRRKMLGLIREIRASLDRAEVREGLPLVSFIPQGDEVQTGLAFT